MKKVALLQSNYIPWKGYFDLIAMVDEFIIYDDVQYTHSDWRNRNRIKTPNGSIWLTVPVYHDGKKPLRIRDTKVTDHKWRKKHWRSIEQSYAKARHFAESREIFEPLYLEDRSEYLSEINYLFIRAVCGLLGIRTRITWSSDYELSGGKTERIVSICRQAGATQYISGPQARNYIDPAQFADAGIELAYINYSGYPEYSQLHGEFEHGVSVLDLLFNMGHESARYMKYASG